jgi:hypothetical protein
MSRSSYTYLSILIVDNSYLYYLAHDRDLLIVLENLKALDIQT